jgi:hypothetical protein
VEFVGGGGMQGKEALNPNWLSAAKKITNLMNAKLVWLRTQLSLNRV